VTGRQTTVGIDEEGVAVAVPTCRTLPTKMASVVHADSHATMGPMQEQAIC